MSGIRVKKQGSTTDDQSSVGLFGFVSGGSVRNIVLRDSKFQGYQNVGGIVGYLSGGTVANCTLYHVLAGTMWVGVSSSAGAGIVAGHDGGTVSGCHYRDCRVGTTYREETGLGGSAFPMVHNDRVDNVYALALDTGVAATPAAVESVVIDGVAYYAAGSTFALGFGGTLQAACVLGGFSATGGATVSGDTLALSAADCTVSPVWTPAWSGGGTAESPYLITTTNELDLLSRMVNGRGGYGYSDFSGVFFRLGADIAYAHTTDWDNAESTENNYTAIGGWRSGSTYNRFCGDFDGDGHTISGIRIYKNSSGTSNGYTGLFGYVGTSGTVHDVTLADARITGQLSVAGIVGLSYGTVTNCTVAADVCVASKNTNSDYHAGIVGKNYGSVSGCTSAVTLTADYAGPDDYGAVVGWNSTNGSITNCLALGATIPAMADNYGVIVGYNNNGTLTANYYRACTVGTATNAVDAGVGRSGGAPADADGARSVHLLRTGSFVSATGGETVVIDGLAHYAAGSAVALVYDGTPAAGTEFAGFVVADENGGASFETDGAFAMPSYDATADSLIITEWAALNRRLAAGGDITLAKDYAATAEDGPLTVPEGVAVTLDLNGHILDRNLAAATNRGLVIDVRGSLAVTDGAPAATHTGALAGIPGGVITGGNSTDNGGGVQVYGSAATFTLSGGTVAGNTATQYGGGVYQYRGAFTLSGGAVSGNTAQYGGGVSVSGGAFTVEGGTVTNNTARTGGGVYLNSGTVTLSGGAVSGNTASTGGGVCVWIGTATLSGGTVSGNSASWGGGVRVNGGSFTMEGGAVSGNTASIGGGVYVNSGTATLSGGTVTGNTASSYGCGVYVQSGGSTHFQISGGPVVSGNPVGGAPNNVHLASGKSVDVVGELTASARLGVTAEAGLGVFTDGLGDKGDATNFFSDDPAWRVRLDDDSGEAELFEPVVLPAYLAGADTVVTNNYLAWAAKYGSDTEGSYESCFLLDLPPSALAACTGALLRVAGFEPTAGGVRLELACDIPGYRFFQPAGDEGDTVLGNGYVGLQAATNLAAFVAAGERPPLPVSATIDPATGRAVLEIDFGLYLRALGAPPGYEPPPPPVLFARPVLTPLRPDLAPLLLLYAEP